MNQQLQQVKTLYATDFKDLHSSSIFFFLNFFEFLQAFTLFK